MTNSPEIRFVGRGGEKPHYALERFGVRPAGMSSEDLGCNVGGFTDCLLQAGAARVYAVDTGYGALAWKLRTDPRVIVLERTNALHAAPHETVDLVVVDLGWTPQQHAIPAALSWLKPEGRIVSLIKPHYEVRKADAKSLLKDGVLEESDAERITQSVVAEFPRL